MILPTMIPPALRHGAVITTVILALWAGRLSPRAIAQPAADPDAGYALTATSTTRGAGVERGAVEERVIRSDGVFPGTIRRMWIYSPAASHLAALAATGRAPGNGGAAVIVFQDGHAYVNETGQFRVPIVLDNLIDAGVMPPAVAIFLDPGHVGEALPGETPGWEPRPSNRSLEYDTLSDAYARFLETEILPEVARTHRLTDDPAWRAICGISSGGICAFTVAFQRPDLFRKVISHVGSFTDIRGGDHYPSLVRQTKGSAKPIRVALQDGENDLDNRHGHWWLGNLQMQKALAFAGYDHLFIGGVGGHNGKHGGMVLPDMLAWTWRDWREGGR
ncbi:MAG: alpha/beta hydrolase [Planctomycetaceae bacterium]